MNAEVIKQLETEIATALASLRTNLSNAQATTGAIDVFLYQLKKLQESVEPTIIEPEKQPPAQ